MIPKIKQFYEKYPYPNYKFIGLNKKEDLYKIKNYIFNLINEEEIKDKEILEVGCGTGVLIAKLSLYGKVTGTDVSNNSLMLAEQLFKKYNLKGEFFYDDIINTNITKQYDIVISLGTIHHTENPETAFNNLCKLTKSNGLILISIYHKYGKIIRKMQEKKEEKDLDENSIIHFLDAHKNPKTSYHSITETLRWFKNNNIKFINAFPAINLFSYFKYFIKFGFNVFIPTKLNPEKDVSYLNLVSKKGNKLSHFLIELLWLIFLYDAPLMIIGKRKKKK